VQGGALMKPLQILMPMGGLGQRFRDAGINTPKPLIEVKGTPMFQKALAAYDSYSGEKQHIFVIRKDIDDEYNLADQLRILIPDAKIKILDHNTRGAVETCLLAEDFIDPNLPLVIMDCDISFDAGNYFTLIEEAVQIESYDGLLLSFNSSDPRYSFAEVDENNTVIRTAEKVAISSNALMGAYFFTHGKLFLDAAHELIDQPISDTIKEYYVSLIYNILINEQKKIGLARGTFYCFGTPEELKAYEESRQ
jgi:NDP-sugar pyrophosphorylase family protein